MIQSTAEQINVVIDKLAALIDESVNAGITPFEQYVLMYGYLINLRDTGNPFSGGGSQATWS
jgi:hypothetical protein